MVLAVSLWLLDYFEWVRSDGHVDVARSEAITQAVVATRSDRQRRAADPTLNGFLVLEKVHDTQPSLYSNLEAFEPFDSERLNPGPHGSCTAGVYAAYATQRSEIEPLAARYERVLPFLEEALARPCFLRPVKDVSGETIEERIQRIAWWQWWRVALNQQAYGQLLEAKGDWRRALDRHLANVSWGARLSRDGWSGWGCDVTNIGLDGVLDLVSRRANDLSDAECRAVMARLNTLAFDPNWLVADADEAYLTSLECVDLVAAQGSRDSEHESQRPSPEEARARRSSGVSWSRLMWMLARHVGEYDRQKRVLGETYLAMRPLVERLVPPDTQGFSDSDVEARLKQGGVVLDRDVLSLGWLNSWQVRRFRQIITETGALQLILALQLWHNTHGGYPERLDALVPSCIATLPPDLLSADGRFTYRREANDYTLRSVPSELFPDPSFFTLEHLRCVWHEPSSAKR